MVAWKVAPCLLKLRDQLNEAYPNRSKASDGTIGDAAHASRDSDHNPWFVLDNQNWVTAADFTHDPENGVDIDLLTDELVATQDPRIKYVIANGWILDSRKGNSPWKWVKYNGANQHTKHFHISVMDNDSILDTSAWMLASLTGDDDMDFQNPKYRDWAGNEQNLASTLNHLDERSVNNEQAVKKLQSDLSWMHKRNLEYLDEVRGLLTDVTGELAALRAELDISNMKDAA